MSQDWPGHLMRTDSGFQEYLATLVSELGEIAERQEHPEDREKIVSITDELEGGELDQGLVAWVAYLESKKKPPEDPLVSNVNYLLRRVLRQQAEQEKAINRILQVVEGLAQRRK